MTQQNPARQKKTTRMWRANNRVGSLEWLTGEMMPLSRWRPQRTRAEMSRDENAAATTHLNTPNDATQNALHSSIHTDKHKVNTCIRDHENRLDGTPRSLQASRPYLPQVRPATETLTRALESMHPTATHKMRFAFDAKAASIAMPWNPTRKSCDQLDVGDPAGARVGEQRAVTWVRSTQPIHFVWWSEHHK